MTQNVRGLRGVSRIDDPKKRTVGWYVRLQRHGVKYSKFFSDSNYQSSAAALNAARRYYYSLVREHPKMSRQEYAERKTARNTSGIIGVRKTTDYRKGHAYKSWVAFWSPKKGVRKVVKFSIKKYGTKEARRLAIEARRKGLAEMAEK